MLANRTQPSPLISALHKLNEYPAIAICKETPVPMPTSRFVTNHLLATHIVRSTEGFEFIPDESTYQTYAILRSANEAWRHDKLPALAVCAFSKSPDPLREATGIQARTVDQFLNHLKSAHRIVPAVGASPAYMTRRYHGSGDKHDDVVLPAHANVVVCQPRGINPKQLTALFEYVASIHGKIILCDDRRELANYHPELTDAVDKRRHIGNVQEALDDVRDAIAQLAKKRDERRDSFVSGIKLAMQTPLGNDAEQVTEALRKQGIGPRLAEQAIKLVPPWQTYSVFTIVDSLTRIAGRYENAGDRLLVDQKAASLLSLAA